MSETKRKSIDTYCKTTGSSYSCFKCPLRKINKPFQTLCKNTDGGLLNLLYAEVCFLENKSIAKRL